MVMVDGQQLVSIFSGQKDNLFNLVILMDSFTVQLMSQSQWSLVVNLDDSMVSGQLLVNLVKPMNDLMTQMALQSHHSTEVNHLVLQVVTLANSTDLTTVSLVNHLAHHSPLDTTMDKSMVSTAADLVRLSTSPMLVNHVSHLVSPSSRSTMDGSALVSLVKLSVSSATGAAQSAAINGLMRQVISCVDKSVRATLMTFVVHLSTAS